MRYAGIDECEICNGLGVGVSLYVQGCNNHCDGCFNPETWDFSGGKEWTLDSRKRLKRLLDRPYITRLSILGGEPLDHKNIADVAYLVSQIRLMTAPNKRLEIWVYTGYIFEDFIDKNGNKRPDVPDELFACYKQLFENIDFLVDGMFVSGKKDSSLAFRGSTNQRILENQFTTGYADSFVNVSDSMDHNS